MNNISISLFHIVKHPKQQSHHSHSALLQRRFLTAKHNVSLTIAEALLVKEDVFQRHPMQFSRRQKPCQLVSEFQVV